MSFQLVAVRNQPFVGPRPSVAHWSCCLKPEHGFASCVEPIKDPFGTPSDLQLITSTEHWEIFRCSASPKQMSCTRRFIDIVAVSWSVYKSGASVEALFPLQPRRSYSVWAFDPSLAICRASITSKGIDGIDEVYDKVSGSLRLPWRELRTLN